jgi:cytochrome o ubiquinol oxidase subunit 1
VHERDAFWEMKQTQSKELKKPLYQDIYIPKNSPMGLFIASFCFLIGFGLTWYMMWLAAVGLFGVITCLIIRLSSDETDELIPALEVEQMETNTNYQK